MITKQILLLCLLLSVLNTTGQDDFMTEILEYKSGMRMEWADSGKEDFLASGKFEEPSIDTVPPHNNVNQIKKLYDHFGKGEIDEVMAMIDSKILWNESMCSEYSDRNPYTTPESVLDGVFKRIGAANEYFKLENIELTTLGKEKVLASLTYHGKTHEGEEYRTRVVHQWTFIKGKVTAFQQYMGI